MKAREVMRKAVFIEPKATKKEILRVVKRHPDIEIFIVGSKGKKFKGAIHENDLFLMFLPNESFEDVGIDLAFDLEKKFFSKTARDIMREQDVFCFQEDDIVDVALQFARVEVNEMPVLDKKKRVVGIISQGRILRHLNVK